MVLPAHFSVPVMAQQDNTPSTNPLTDAGATLGRVLFYDKRLSINDTVSCSSCHRRENGFSDPRKASLGFAGGAGDRNAMGLTNARWYERRSFFWDERAATLEAQVLRPIQDPVEMGMTTAALVTKLEGTSYYAGLFSAAFGSPGITVDRVSRALAQFIRSIVSVSSKYDQGVPLNFSNFTAEEALGRQLFLGQVGRATCAACHGTDSFTPTQRINNNGLENPYLDKGVGALTGLAQDEGLFKVPTLRNIELTAPYMHDGRFSTLEQVVEFYNSGVVDHPNLSPPLRSPPPVPGSLRLNFTIAQKTALVAFLKTLTDRSVVEAVRFSDPFPAEVAPQITQQPVVQIVSVGARVVLAVVATGVPSPSFQWFKNGGCAGWRGRGESHAGGGGDDGCGDVFGGGYESGGQCDFESGDCAGERGGGGVPGDHDGAAIAGGAAGDARDVIGGDQREWGELRVAEGRQGAGGLFWVELPHSKFWDKRCGQLYGRGDEQWRQHPIGTSGFGSLAEWFRGDARVERAGRRAEWHDLGDQHVGISGGNNGVGLVGIIAGGLEFFERRRKRGADAAGGGTDGFN